MIAIVSVVFPMKAEITKLLFPLGLDAAYAGGSDDLRHFLISVSKESTNFLQCEF